MSLKGKYEISVWEDVKATDGSYFDEKKILTIGSSEMTTLARATNIKITHNINGTNELVFSLYTKYYDEREKQDKDNPYIPYLCNERKVKLKDENNGEVSWYDFVIKNIEESSDKKEFIYTCKDLFVNELSKNGYDLEFDIDLQNNQGTAVDLGKKIVEGTDWTIDEEHSDVEMQYIEEPLVHVKLKRIYSITGYSMLEEKPNGPVTDSEPSVTLSGGAEFYIFYSDVVNMSERVQFLYKQNGDYIKDDDNVIIEKDNYYFNLKDLVDNDWKWYDEQKSNYNNLPYLCKGVISVFEQNDGINENYYVSNEYRGKKLIRSQKSTYDPQIEKQVDVYKDIEDGKDVYCFQDIKSFSAATVRNLLANGENMSSTQGWYKANSSTETPDISIDYDTSSTGIILPYLKFSKDEEYYNSGFIANKIFLEDLNINDDYILEIVSDSYFPSIDFKLSEYNETITSKTPTGVPLISIPKPKVNHLEGKVHNRLMLIEEDGQRSLHHYYVRLQANQSISKQKLKNGQFGFFMCFNLSPLSEEDSYKIYSIRFYKAVYKNKAKEITLLGRQSYPSASYSINNSGYIAMGGPGYRFLNDLYDNIGSYFSKNNSVSDTYGTIQYIQFVLNNTGDNIKFNWENNTPYLVYQDEPFTYWTDVNQKRQLNFYTPEDAADTEAWVQNNFYDPTQKISSIDELQFLYQGKDKAPERFEPQYDYTYSQIKSIEGKESNRFNLIQNINEKFKCWARFNIDHDENGKIAKDNRVNNTLDKIPKSNKYYYIDKSDFGNNDSPVFYLFKTKEDNLSRVAFSQTESRLVLSTMSDNLYYNRLVDIKNKLNKIDYFINFSKIYYIMDIECSDILSTTELVELKILINNYEYYFSPSSETEELSITLKKGLENWIKEYSSSSSIPLELSYHDNVSEGSSSFYLSIKSQEGNWSGTISYKITDEGNTTVLDMKPENAEPTAPGIKTELNSSWWPEISVLPADIKIDEQKTQRTNLNEIGFSFVRYRNVFKPWIENFLKPYDVNIPTPTLSGTFNFNISYKYDSSQNDDDVIKVETIGGTDYYRINGSYLVNFDPDITYNEYNGLPRLKKSITFNKYIGKQNFAGFKYGINLNSINRTIDSDQITSKIIVRDNSNEHATNKFCSITRANENSLKENFAFDFRYYIRNKLISEHQLNTDLYGPIGLYTIISNTNKDKIDLINQQAEYSILINEYKAFVQEKAAELDSSTLELEEAIRNYENYRSGRGTPYSNWRNTPIDVLAQPFLGSSYATAKEYIVKVKEFEKTKNNAQKNLEDYQEKLDLSIEKYDEITTKLKENAAFIKQKLQEFFFAYGRFIQEGNWISEDYIDDNLYYYDAMNVLATSAMPKISYTFNVLDLSLLTGYELYSFGIGDKTYVEDTEFFGYKEDGKTPYHEEVIISEIVRYLDNPANNEIKVQNYKTQFEDLFQRVAAASQSLEFHEGEYAKVASNFDEYNHIDKRLLQSSINAANLIISNIEEQSVTWGTDGINIEAISDPLNKVRIVNKGIILTDNGGETWATAISGKGINASYINVGRLDANKIKIMNGDSEAFSWDKDGLIAYSQYGESYQEYKDSGENTVRGQNCSIFPSLGCNYLFIKHDNTNNTATAMTFAIQNKYGNPAVIKDQLKIKYSDFGSSGNQPKFVYNSGSDLTSGGLIYHPLQYDSYRRVWNFNNYGSIAEQLLYRNTSSYFIVKYHTNSESEDYFYLYLVKNTTLEEDISSYREQGYTFTKIAISFIKPTSTSGSQEVDKWTRSEFRNYYLISIDNIDKANRIIYNYLGIYGTTRGDTIDFKDIDIVQNYSNFSLTWRGLRINNNVGEPVFDVEDDGTVLLGGFYFDTEKFSSSKNNSSFDIYSTPQQYNIPVTEREAITGSDAFIRGAWSDSSDSYGTAIGTHSVNSSVGNFANLFTRSISPLFTGLTLSSPDFLLFMNTNDFDPDQEQQQLCRFTWSDFVQPFTYSADYLIAKLMYNTSYGPKIVVDMCTPSSRGVPIEWRGQLTTSSDRTLKKNIVPINSDLLAFFDDLHPVTYEYKKDSLNRTYFGFVAQDIEKSFENIGLDPNSCALYSEGEYKTLCYTELIALCVAKIQALAAEIKKLKNS